MNQVRIFGVRGGWLKVWSNGVLIQHSGERK